MRSFNKISIVGFAGKNAELRYTPQGKAICKFSIATSERRKNATGEAEEQTLWFSGEVWGQQAEFCNEYVSKGQALYVSGRLRQDEWTDRDGNNRTTLIVTADDVQLLGSRSESSGEGNRQQNRAAMSAQAPSRQQQQEDEGITDSIPF